MEKALSEEAAAKLLSSINIPPRPSVIVELNKEKSKEDPDLRRIVQIISKDIALTASLLKTANSPWFYCCVVHNYQLVAAYFYP